MFQANHGPLSNLSGLINTFKSLSGGNPQAMYDYMYESNPNFKEFADSVKDKTPEQAFSEHGMNFDQIRGLMN